jgi:hypothetical protein
MVAELTKTDLQPRDLALWSWSARGLARIVLLETDDASSITRYAWKLA